MLKKIFKIIGLSIIIIIIFIGAFISNFPLNNLLESNIDKVNNLIAPYNLSYKSAESSFTGLKINGIEASSNIENMYLLVNTVSVPFFSFAFFTGQIPVETQLYRGTMDVKYDLFQNKVALDFANINIGEIALLEAMELFTNSPKLTGSVNLNLSSNSSRVDFQLSNTVFNGRSKSIDLALNILPEEIIFTSISGDVSVQRNNKINLTVKLKGNFNGSISGQVVLNQRNNSASVLNLTIKGELSEAFYQDNQDLFFLAGEYLSNRNLHLHISGKANNPQIKKL